MYPKLISEERFNTIVELMGNKNDNLFNDADYRDKKSFLEKNMVDRFPGAANTCYNKCKNADYFTQKSDNSSLEFNYTYFKCQS